MKLKEATVKDFLNGQIILINKPISWSSFDVVKKIKYLIKKKYSIKKIKVGHAGTLDPLATGLLILCTGKLTKTISEIQNQKKVYSGTITLGGTTPSFDLETEIDKKYNTAHINESQIQSTVKKFTGKIQQTPPIYSAIKQNGERLYKKARRGECVKVNSRIVTIDHFKINSFKNLNICFEIKCSKGTYIRSIAHEFGLALNSGGHLSSLCRVAIGKYRLEDAFSIEDFERFLNT